MDIEEEETGPSVRPPDYEIRQKGIPDFKSQVLAKHFSTLIVGRPESGKTHIIYEYISNPQLY